MFNIIVSNPMVIVVAALIVLLFVVKILFVPSKKKKSKDVKIDEAKKVDKPAEPVKDESSGEEKPVIVLKKKKSAKTKKLKHVKEKPTISRVYERVETKEKKQEEKELEPEISEDELLSKMQFVKTDKKVSKLVKNDINQSNLEISDDNTDESNQSSYHVHQGDGECIVEKIAKTKHGHFDKSRRLSRCVKDDNFDEMFCSHINEDYMNINIDRHLNVNGKFSEGLFSRASQTLANSASKVMGSDDKNESESLEIRSNKDSMRAWLENKKREELAKLMIEQGEIENNDGETVVDSGLKDVELTAKSLIVSQMIMSRKKRSKH